MKSSIISGALSLGLLAITVSPVFAATTAATASNSSNDKVVCLASAVNEREQSLGAAATSYTAAINGAYAARATALQHAYTQSTQTAIQKADIDRVEYRPKGGGRTVTRESKVEKGDRTEKGPPPRGPSPPLRSRQREPFRTSPSSRHGTSA